MEFVYILLLSLSMLLFLYNYIFYPVCIYTLSKIIKDKHVDKISNFTDDFKVSFIIAAYNEEKVIREKLLNTLNINYPRSKLEIIVVSDGSDDSTPDIVREFEEQGVISLHVDERKGKSAALNRAVDHSTGDIIVFSDANNDFDPESIKLLVRHFFDESIGAVTGAKHIYSSDDRQASQGDGLYWKYESIIKSSESHLGSITAAEGEILAVKRALFKPINPSFINDDAAITFDIVKSGHRILYEKNAKTFEHASKDLLDDFHVKVRMTNGGFQTIKNEFHYLFPPKNWFSIAFISHKVLRWFAPHFLIIIFITSLLLSYYPLLRLFLSLQIAFYGLAAYGWINRGNKDLPSWIYIPTYFTSMNAALFYGFICNIKNISQVNWRKAER